ncbi:MAG: glycosyltransferase, partial [Patescibacteria group bacterium]
SEILTASEPWEFAEKISEILSSEDKISQIGMKAREFIEQNYRWEKIAEKLDSVYKHVVS